MRNSGRLTGLARGCRRDVVIRTRPRGGTGGEARHAACAACGRRDHRLEQPAILRQAGAIALGVRQVNDAGREAPILAAHAGMQQPHEEIGILTAPAAEACIEAVDPFEVRPPDREVA